MNGNQELKLHISYSTKPDISIPLLKLHPSPITDEEKAFGIVAKNQLALL